MSISGSGPQKSSELNCDSIFLTWNNGYEKQTAPLGQNSALREYPREFDSIISLHFTIIPRARVAYEMVDSQGGA